MTFFGVRSMARHTVETWITSIRNGVSSICNNIMSNSYKASSHHETSQGYNKDSSHYINYINKAERNASSKYYNDSHDMFSDCRPSSNCGK